MLLEQSRIPFYNHHKPIIWNMASKIALGMPAIIIGILIAATEALNLMGTLNYLWAVLVLLWGVMVLAQKRKKK
ncbi:MAG: hypothetical protein HZB67_05660 [Candidatus Aenigmarchaeota archaeon]|nr:hypothetical protein [Candidatus Aenigmarchaeota archaeon]